MSGGRSRRCRGRGGEGLDGVEAAEDLGQLQQLRLDGAEGPADLGVVQHRLAEGELDVAERGGQGVVRIVAYLPDERNDLAKTVLLHAGSMAGGRMEGKRARLAEPPPLG